LALLVNIHFSFQQFILIGRVNKFVVNQVVCSCPLFIYVIISLALTELQQQQQDRNYHHHQQSQNDNNNGTWLKVAAGFGLAASAAFAFQKQLQDSGRDSLLFTTALALKGKVAEEAGQFVDGMQVFTSDDVAKHQDEKTGIWIVN